MTRAEEYQAYLQSDHWRKLRSEAIVAHGDSCSCCQKRPVQVHHLRYGNWYDVTTDDLIPLCDACHEKSHSIRAAAALIYTDRPSSQKRARLLSILSPNKPAFASRSGAERKKRTRRQMRRIVEERTGLPAKHSNNISKADLRGMIESDFTIIPKAVQKMVSRFSENHQTKPRNGPIGAPFSKFAQKPTKLRAKRLKALSRIAKHTRWLADPDLEPRLRLHHGGMLHHWSQKLREIDAIIPPHPEAIHPDVAALDTDFARALAKEG